MSVKNKLIEEFNNIVKASMNISLRFPVKNEKKEATILIATFNTLGEAVNNFAHKCCSVMTIENDKEFSDLNDKIRGKIHSTRDEITVHLYNILCIINELRKDIYSSESDSLLETLCSEEGCVSLILRFEIIEVFRDESYLEKLCVLLNEVSEASNDYWAVEAFHQWSQKYYYESGDSQDTAIVVQGPVVTEKDFTLETLYRYRFFNPGSPIVLSTWKGEVSDYLRWCARSVGIDLLENDIPGDTGKTNIKMQIFSSRYGIRFIDEHYEVKYCLKTRTDQRILLPDFMTFLKNMLKVFPPDSNELKERIVFLSDDASSYDVPFRICDFLAFGDIDDVKGIYEATGDEPKLIDRNGIGEEVEKYNCHCRKVIDIELFRKEQGIFKMSESEKTEIACQFENSLDPEMYLARTFYERKILGRKLTVDDDIFSHYWRFIKKYIVIVDSNQLQLYWNKYGRKHFANTYANLSFSSWLNIYLHGEEISSF